jgi:hypothetical protein
MAFSESKSGAANLSKYFPVKTPPARTLYAIHPTFSCTGELASETPFSNILLLIKEKSPCKQHGSGALTLLAA